MCYGSVQHYSSTKACFIKKLQELLEDEYEYTLNHLIRWRNRLIKA